MLLGGVSEVFVDSFEIPLCECAGTFTTQNLLLIMSSPPVSWSAWEPALLVDVIKQVINGVKNDEL